MFYVFYKIVGFSVNKEKDDKLYEALTVNSHNLETTNHVLMSNTLVDQSKPTYYPNYFITTNTTFTTHFF